MLDKYDVCIIGGGMIGLALAKGLADNSIKVCVIEGGKPERQWDSNSHALRVSAINRNSELLLKKLNAWHNIAADCCSPYKNMHVWDASGDGEINMNCIDVGETELGHIIENRAILKALYESAGQSNGLDIITETKVSDIKGESGNWQIKLNDDKSIKAKLIVGADGANSWVRKKMGFDLTEKAYNQNAIVGVIETEFEHQDTAWQRFLPTGPLAFLPLKNKFHCSIVWSCETDKANALVKLDDNVFCSELNSSIEGRFGKIKLLTKKVQFPLIQRHAKSYYQAGVVLVGDAAHTIHPLAGQGVNLGFKDVSALIDILSLTHKSNRLIEHESTLSKYEERRRLNNKMTILSMKMFKEFFSNEIQPLSSLRNFGLSSVDKIKPLKNIFINQAMGL